MTAAREAGRHVVITKTEMTVWLFRRLIRNCEKVMAVRASRAGEITLPLLYCTAVCMQSDFQ